jgi:hypothetical protein
MFSPQLKKYVFIDFGLSQIINQDMGLKTKSNFIGSL